MSDEAPDGLRQLVHARALLSVPNGHAIDENTCANEARAKREGDIGGTSGFDRDRQAVGGQLGTEGGYCLSGGTVEHGANVLELAWRVDRVAPELPLNVWVRGLQRKHLLSVEEGGQSHGLRGGHHCGQWVRWDRPVMLVMRIRIGDSSASDDAEQDTLDLLAQLGNDERGFGSKGGAAPYFSRLEVGEVLQNCEHLRRSQQWSTRSGVIQNEMLQLGTGEGTDFGQRGASESLDVTTSRETQRFEGRPCRVLVRPLFGEFHLGIVLLACCGGFPFARREIEDGGEGVETDFIAVYNIQLHARPRPMWFGHFKEDFHGIRRDIHAMQVQDLEALTGQQKAHEKWQEVDLLLGQRSPGR